MVYAHTPVFAVGQYTRICTDLIWGRSRTLLRRMGLGDWQATCAADGGGVTAPDRCLRVMIRHRKENEKGKKANHKIK